MNKPEIEIGGSVEINGKREVIMQKYQNGLIAFEDRALCVPKWAINWSTYQPPEPKEPVDWVNEFSDLYSPLFPRALEMMRSCQSERDDALERLAKIAEWVKHWSIHPAAEKDLRAILNGEAGQ
jgi:hypothetical protein